MSTLNFVFGLMAGLGMWLNASHGYWDLFGLTVGGAVLVLIGAVATDVKRGSTP